MAARGERRAAEAPREGRPAGVPARAGLSFKPQHGRDVLDGGPEVAWFEVHAENYMGEGGPPHRWLTAVRERYPLSVHGVGLSLGSAGPLDRAHLARLAAVVARYEPGLVSEHLAWTRHGDTHFNDLLPVPLTEEALAVMAAHVDETQEALGRTILVENPSTYVSARDAAYDEPAFLAALARRTGCGLLVDVNNVYVSARNHGFDAEAWLDAIPADPVGEIHLAGHRAERLPAGELLIDDHGSAVAEAVWRLFERFVARIGPRPVLVEWDNDVPAFDVLLAEARRAQSALDRAGGRDVRAA